MRKSHDSVNSASTNCLFFSLGRRPVFYISVALIIFGRVMSTMTTFIYWLFASAAIIGMLTSATIFTSPLIIAMETGKE